MRQLAQADNEDAIKEAISAMNCYWVDQGLNVVQSKQKDAKTVEEVINRIFGNRITSLNRNEIVFIRTDYYTDPDLAAAVMLAIKKDKINNITYHEYDRQLNEADKNDSSYQISSIKDVLEDTKHRYEYPVDTSCMPDDMKPDYHHTYITNQNFQEEFLKRYIGAPEITRADRMPGFTKKEVALADKTGLVKTAPPQTVFLTFDDWGHDDSINKILYVLRKHSLLLPKILNRILICYVLLYQKEMRWAVTPIIMYPCLAWTSGDGHILLRMQKHIVIIFDLLMRNWQLSLET